MDEVFVGSTSREEVGDGVTGVRLLGKETTSIFVDFTPEEVVVLAPVVVSVS